MSTKKILIEELKKLDKKYKLIDSGFDWLRLGTNEELRFLIDLKKHKFNSTTGNSIYNYKGFDLVIKNKNRNGTSYNFIRNYNFNGFTIPINLFSITDKGKNNNIGYKINITFYGLFFQLDRLGKLNKQEEINYILLGAKEPIKCNRTDYNFNYSLENKKAVENHIRYLSYKYMEIKKKSIYNLETFTLRYRVSNGRDKETGKVINKETKRMGLKFYDKSKNIQDLGLGSIYLQYENIAVLRVEALLGSEALKNVYFTTFEELEKKVLEKIIGQEHIIETQNKNKKIIKTKSYLEKNKKVVESYLETYLKNGGRLEELNINGYGIFEFIEKKGEIDEVLFKKDLK